MAPALSDADSIRRAIGPSRLLAAALLAVVAACTGGGGGTDVGSEPAPGPAPEPPPPAVVCETLDFGGDPVGPAPMRCFGGCECTSIGFVPLTELGRGTYQGFEGGLYCERSNAPPPEHLEAGLRLARGIVPLDAEGRPDPAGRYVLISVGMSNTTQEFSAFRPLALADPERDPALVIVDGAQGGQPAGAWTSPTAPTWDVVDQRLAAAGVTPQQVVAAWIKQAHPGPTAPFPQDAARLATDLADIVRSLKVRYPNAALAYFSSRIYAGYATTSLNPEPFAYQSAFAVKKLVLDQVTGDPSLAFDPARGPAVAPWVGWGPYLWADGLTPRGDGLVWECADFAPDGTHPSTSGRAKVAQMPFDFVRGDPTAREWYLARP